MGNRSSNNSAKDIESDISPFLGIGLAVMTTIWLLRKQRLAAWVLTLGLGLGTWVSFLLSIIHYVNFNPVVRALSLIPYGLGACFGYALYEERVRLGRVTIHPANTTAGPDSSDSDGEESRPGPTISLSPSPLSLDGSMNTNTLTQFGTLRQSHSSAFRDLRSAPANTLWPTAARTGSPEHRTLTSKL